MVNLRKQTSSTPSYPTALLLKLKSEICVEENNVCQLVSGDEKAFVHCALLSNASAFLQDMFSSVCCCESNIFILPSSSPSTLDTFVTLLYTGSISDISRNQAGQVVKLARELDINITCEVIDSAVQPSTISDDNVENCKKELKLKSKMVNKFGSLSLSLPISRSNRQKLPSLHAQENMTGFQARVQREYNNHPVGMYMGPYDQNRNLELKIQLPDSNLHFRNFTEFHHPGGECFHLGLKSYENYDDLDKIDAYRIVMKATDDEESDTDSEEQENDVKVYTCQLGSCKIPCPCPQCHSNQSQCLEHKLRHETLFDEKQDAISIKSSQEFCLEESFFKKSYILKFSGIPITCKKCKRDLLLHHCYHFEYHEKCRFCKPSWFKHKAKTKEELKSLEKKEANYFKRVCPFCDKQFIRSIHMKKHIEYEHDGAKYKCNFCERAFNSHQAKTYHEKLKHSLNLTSVHCEKCKKTFASEVSLKVHLKYVHSDKRRESCPHCD